MGINISNTEYQARVLSMSANELLDLRRQLLRYKDCIISNWQGSEILYIAQSIDQTIAQITALERDINILSNDIRETARKIQAEQMAKILSKIK